MSKQIEEIYAVQIMDKSKIGLHARPIAKIVKAMSNKKYEHIDIKVTKLEDETDLNKKIIIKDNQQIANGKSILNFIGLTVKNENKLAFILKGENKEEIEELIADIEKVLKEEKLIS